MRVIFGIVLGVALTLGAAALHDNNLAQPAAGAALTDRPIVNWDVLGAVTRDTAGSIAALVHIGRK